MGSTFNSLIQKINSHALIGIEIRDAQSGKIIYEKNSHTLMRPASVEKIPTALMVLSKLGPTYQFKTSLYKKQNDIYVKFRGDPTFTMRHLQELLGAYKKREGSTLSGNIIVNKENVPPFPHFEGWSVEATRFLYGAPISAININKNSVCLKMVPSKTPHQKPLIIYDKHQPAYKVDNQAISAACAEEDYIQRCDLDLEETVSLKGCVPHGSDAFKICLPVKEHRFKEYVRKCFHKALADAGIHFKGKILFRDFSEKPLTLVAEHRSAPLFEILKVGMKDSDDTVMESVLIPFMLEEPLKFRNAKYLNTFMRQTLQQSLGVDLSDSFFMDGSGLSHHNLISAHQVADLLWQALNHKSLKEPFLASLAIGGEDGTLKSRLKNLPGGIRVLAKTGTLTSMRNLAGYIFRGEKPAYIFSIMMQNFSENGKVYEDLQDKIIVSLSHSIP